MPMWWHIVWWMTVFSWVAQLYEDFSSSGTSLWYVDLTPMDHGCTGWFCLSHEGDFPFHESKIWNSEMWRMAAVGTVTLWHDGVTCSLDSTPHCSVTLAMLLNFSFSSSLIFNMEIVVLPHDTIWGLSEKTPWNCVDSQSHSKDSTYVIHLLQRTRRHPSSFAFWILLIQFPFASG
jgi:hypothetical protein